MKCRAVCAELNVLRMYNEKLLMYLRINSDLYFIYNYHRDIYGFMRLALIVFIICNWKRSGGIVRRFQEQKICSTP